MKPATIIFAALIGLFLAATAPEPVLAQPEHDRVLKGRERGDLIPYGVIARRAESRFGGRVVGQKVRRTGPDTWVYDLRLLRENGQVLNVVMDAKTGRVIRTSER